MFRDRRVSSFFAFPSPFERCFGHGTSDDPTCPRPFRPSLSCFSKGADQCKQAPTKSVLPFLLSSPRTANLNKSRVSPEGDVAARNQTNGAFGITCDSPPRPSSSVVLGLERWMRNPATLLFACSPYDWMSSTDHPTEPVANRARGPESSVIVTPGERLCKRKTRRLSHFVSVRRKIR